MDLTQLHKALALASTPTQATIALTLIAILENKHV